MAENVSSLTLGMSSKDEANFGLFCVCPENDLNKKDDGNDSFEMPALELFWGNPNGQFFNQIGGVARRGP